MSATVAVHAAYGVAGYVAFVTLPGDVEATRIRRATNRWRCDVHPDDRDGTCDHARALNTPAAAELIRAAIVRAETRARVATNRIALSAITAALTDPDAEHDLADLTMRQLRAATHRLAAIAASAILDAYDGDTAAAVLAAAAHTAAHRDQP